MVPLLKPPLFISAEGVDVFWGDGQARKLGRLHSADGQSWQVGDPGNVNEVNGLTATYSSFQVGKTWIIADQQELAAKKNFFGVTELESDDEGRTWRTARVVDLSMEKPYALFGTGDGEARGYLVYALGLAAATFDGGRHWVKATFPRELSSGAYTISPKLGFLVSSHEQLPDKSWVVRLARLAPS